MIVAPRPVVRWITCVLCLLTGAGVACAQQTQPYRVLFVTQSKGYQHRVVHRPDPDTLSLAERILTDAGGDQLKVDCTQDASVITADKLKNYDAVGFYTTGELPISDAGKKALIQFVHDGGGFFGVHSATDTFYDWPAYGKLIGGYFTNHPWHQKVRVTTEDSAHPATAHLADGLNINDEIYNFRNFSRDSLHVLMSLDNGSVDVSKGERDDEDYALTWTRTVGKGRVFYTALGHEPAVWKSPKFQRLLVQGIRWSAGWDTVGEKAPDGATTLFDGSSLDPFQKLDGSDAGWKKTDGDAMVVNPGSGDIRTRDEFHDFRMHIEFAIPKLPDSFTGQNRGNSGVYLFGRYEIQVLGSHFDRPLHNNECGAIYKIKAPDVNATKPDGQWQAYDIAFHAPRLDDDGKVTKQARVTVYQNGQLIQDNVQIPHPTGSAMAYDEVARGPIMLQDHGHKVRYRNIWIEPISTHKTTKKTDNAK